MSRRISFNRMDEAREFRAEHREHLCSDDDARSKEVVLSSSAPEEILAEAEERAVGGARSDVKPRMAELSDREREKLEARPGWTWQQNGMEARWAKGTLQGEGATEWLDFYEAGEGWEGGLKNMAASAERSAQTGAATGQRIDRDPATASAERLQRAAEGTAQACDHAEDVCRMGDPDACEFLRETCGFSEAEVAELAAAEERLETVPEPPERVTAGEPTGAQLNVLRRSWGGYKGALAAIREGEEVERHHNLAHRAFDAINSVRAELGQEPLEPRELPEALQEAEERRGGSTPSPDPSAAPGVRQRAAAAAEWVVPAAVGLLAVAALAREARDSSR